MTKEWKISQELYHRMHTEHTDDLSNFKVELKPNDIIEYCIKYVESDKIGWVYPSKSYIVAICYASWLSEDFGEDFYELLNDPDLLHGNDPYYKLYSEDPSTYDELVLKYGKSLPLTGVIPDVRKYYEEEFYTYR